MRKEFEKMAVLTYSNNRAIKRELSRDIGGYQPAQKWLKDRKGRTLSFEDILHYQKIIKALVETDRLMQVIDQLNIV